MQCLFRLFWLAQPLTFTRLRLLVPPCTPPLEPLMRCLDYSMVMVTIYSRAMVPLIFVAPSTSTTVKSTALPRLRKGQIIVLGGAALVDTVQAVWLGRESLRGQLFSPEIRCTAAERCTASGSNCSCPVPSACPVTSLLQQSRARAPRRGVRVTTTCLRIGWLRARMTEARGTP